ncbi:MAG: hypothetical protein JXR55_03605, partial [Candidatus Fermentibacteraceae bacterium]|nr:hypothetical protein [Candidatus Fermentibacteraceae bacterium]
MTRTALLCMALISGCGSGNGPGTASSLEYSPIIIIAFRGMEATAGIPWDIAAGRGRISAAALIHGDVEPGGYAPLLEEAVERGMLVALVSDTIPDLSLGDDDMRIWSDSSGGLHTSPEELLSQLPGSMALDSVKYHQLLLDLWDVYKPDLVMMDMCTQDPSDVMELAGFWTSPEVLSKYRVVIYSLSDDPPRRGWFILAGSGINGATPYGVTESGFFTTVRLLMGL